MGKGPCWEAWAGRCLRFVLASFGWRKTYTDEISRRWCDCRFGLGEQYLLDVVVVGRFGSERHDTRTQRRWDAVNG